MRFSIIMPAHLGFYKGCATNREAKFDRAIQSVLGQTFQDFELIIISDGCAKTVELAKPYFFEYLPKIRILEIPKQPIWSGAVRNAGISKAHGEIITYLDSDDLLGANHLQIINDNFGDADWVFYDDINGKTLIPNKTKLEPGFCGTSTVSHKRSLGVLWNNNSYAHDMVLIRELANASKKYKKIITPEYYTCHIPNQYEV
jgi:glycosyltransferase involved in cell wall biosynthesis